MLDWVSSEALVGMEWGERLPNTSCTPFNCLAFL